MLRTIASRLRGSCVSGFRDGIDPILHKWHILASQFIQGARNDLNPERRRRSEDLSAVHRSTYAAAFYALINSDLADGDVRTKFVEAVKKLEVVEAFSKGSTKLQYPGINDPFTTPF